MKTPIHLTIVLIAAGVGWGFKEQQALSVIREQHRLALIEARELGLFADGSAGKESNPHSKRQREDSIRSTKEFASRLISFAKEMEEAEKKGRDEEARLQRRLIEMLDQLLSLNSGELKILIGELRGRADLKDDMRKGMIGFCIMSLSQDHPEKALEIFTESSDLLTDIGMGKHVLSSALAEWAKDRPLAAVEWMKRNASKFPDLINDDSKRAVVSGAASKDFGLAFELVGTLGLSDDDSILSAIAETAGTLDRQKELMSVIRVKASGMSDPAKAAEFSQIGAINVFSQVSQSGYDAAMDWLKSANLNERETNGILADIQYHRTKADMGRWLDWIGGGNDSKISQDVTRNLVRDWTRNDYKAAGEWLAAAPAGSNKETAVMSYAETVAPYDPEVAAQWAATLDGNRKEETLKRIHAALEAKDPAAAGEFAKRHGLKTD